VYWWKIEDLPRDGEAIRNFIVLFKYVKHPFKVGDVVCHYKDPKVFYTVDETSTSDISVGGLCYNAANFTFAKKQKRTYADFKWE
jgi:hypothetical protein